MNNVLLSAQRRLIFLLSFQKTGQGIIVLDKHNLRFIAQRLIELLKDHSFTIHWKLEAQSHILILGEKLAGDRFPNGKAINSSHDLAVAKITIVTTTQHIVITDQTPVVFYFTQDSVTINTWHKGQEAILTLRTDTKSKF